MAFVAVLLSACARDRHYTVGADEFLRLAAQPVGSIERTEFVGATRTRAFLVRWSGMPSTIGGGTDVFSVGLDELPDAIATQIRRGANPWPKP